MNEADLSLEQDLKEVARAALDSGKVFLFAECFEKGYEPNEEDCLILKQHAIVLKSPTLYFWASLMLGKIEEEALIDIIATASQKGEIEELQRLRVEYGIEVGLYLKQQALLVRVFNLFYKKIKTIKKNKNKKEGDFRGFFIKKFLPRSNLYMVDAISQQSFLIIHRKDFESIKFWLECQNDLNATFFCGRLMEEADAVDLSLFGSY